MKNSFLDYDATKIAQLLKNRNLKSTEVVSATIEQINKVNLQINALVEERFDKALEEAKKFDQLNSSTSSKKGPLAGLPISVKEALHVTEMKTTGGLEHRQDLIYRETAEVIQLLQDAGAIIIGKTNTSTLSFAQETDNKLYGRTNNPWDLSRTAGGSTGGEAALIATGGSFVGIGSDVGGSIRIPAHFNGIIGFKPGMYQVSDNGHYPSFEEELQKRMFSIGPMGKSVRDMELVYQIISKRTLPTNFLNDYQIEILSDHMHYPLSEPTRKSLEQVKDFLEQILPTKKSVPPLFDDSALMWQEIMSIDGSKLIEQEAYSNDRSSAFPSYLKEKITKRTRLHPYISWAITGAKLYKPSNRRIREIKETLERGDEWLADYLRNRILVFPVYHDAAPIHGQVFKEIFSIKKTYLKYMPYTAYANVWGLPSLTIPISQNEHGMPIGIQIIAGVGNESAIFSLGKIIEKKFGGYKRCNYYD